MISINRGENVPVRLILFDETGALFDPTETPEVLILDPNGTSWLAQTALSRSSIGKYFLNPVTLADATLGRYQVKYIIEDMGLTFIEYDEFDMVH